MTHKILEGLLPLAEPIDSIYAMQGNPRRGDVDSVAKSLDKFGQHRPIVVQRSTNEILIGNHTHKAAVKLGWDRIAVLFTDDDRETALARSLADNRTHDSGTYDDAELAAMMAEVNQADESLLIQAGFDEQEIDSLLASLETPEEPIPSKPKVEDPVQDPDELREDIQVERVDAKDRQNSQFQGYQGEPGEPMLFIGDCLDVLAELPDDCIDAVVTDPLGGMNAKRDKNEGDEENWWRYVPGPDFWNEISRVMKPGAHMAVLGTPTTFHRLAVVIEECDLPLRDTLVWMFTHCMPMAAVDIGMQVDQARGGDGFPYLKEVANMSDDDRSRFEAKDDNEWNGWSTGLKPSWRPILLHRKSFDGVVTDQVMSEGTGAINIDATRVGDEEREVPGGGTSTFGRWPANVILDGDVGLDVGDWARYFLSTGPTMTERSVGLPAGRSNNHPKVRPVDLTRWLVRLVTPPGGVVLDPFCGSGTTGVAAIDEGMAFIGIDRNERWITDVAQHRLAEARNRRDG